MLWLRGAYFIIVTLSFSIVLQLVIINWVDVTNGPMGILGIPYPAIGSFEFSSKTSYFYLVVTSTVVTIWCIRRLINSRTGRAFEALRENENVAMSIGVSKLHYSLLAFCIGAGFAGLAGALYAYYVSVITPEMFGFDVMVTMLVMVAVGGKGTLSGPVIGAILVTFVPEQLRMVQDYPAFDIRRRPDVVGRAHAERRGEPGSNPWPLLATLEALVTDTADVLQVKGLTKRFEGVTAVDAVDLEVRRGEIVGLIGPNGAGKTTLFGLVAGFAKPTAGKVYFRGADITGMPPHRRGMLGIVCTFQKTALFPNVTVEQAVRMGQHRSTSAGAIDALLRTSRHRREEAVTHVRAAEVLDLVGLTACADQRRPAACPMVSSGWSSSPSLLPPILSSCCLTNRPRA